jgi:hypothetical protein
MILLLAFTSIQAPSQPSIHTYSIHKSVIHQKQQHTAVAAAAAMKPWANKNNLTKRGNRHICFKIYTPFERRGRYLSVLSEEEARIFLPHENFLERSRTARWVRDREERERKMNYDDGETTEMDETTAQREIWEEFILIILSFFTRYWFWGRAIYYLFDISELFCERRHFL